MPIFDRGERTVVVAKPFNAVFAAVQRFAVSNGRILDQNKGSSSGQIYLKLSGRMFPRQGPATVEVSISHDSDQSTRIQVSSSTMDGFFGLGTAEQAIDTLINHASGDDNPTVPIVTEPLSAVAHHSSSANRVREVAANIDPPTKSDDAKELPTVDEFRKTSCSFCSKRRKADEKFDYTATVNRRVKKTDGFQYRFVTETFTESFTRCEYCAESHATVEKLHNQGLVACAAIGALAVVLELTGLSGILVGMGLPRDHIIRWLTLFSLCMIPGIGVRIATGAYLLFQGTDSTAKVRHDLAVRWRAAPPMRLSTVVVLLSFFVFVAIVIRMLLIEITKPL